MAVVWLALAMGGQPIAAEPVHDAWSEPRYGAHTPRVAIVMCDGTYDEDWEIAHMSSQALVGLAGLAGVPYDTLLLSELLAAPDAGYTSIWFSSCQAIPQPRMSDLVAFLDSYMAGGGTVLLDGPLAARSGSEGHGTARDLEPILGVTGDDWEEVEGYAVYTTDAEHAVARHAGHAPFAQLTQGVADGTEIVTLVDEEAPGSAVLLELVPADEGAHRPYLVVAEPSGGGKVAAISGYGSFMGAATCFRNDTPAGFFDNQLLSYLVETALWLVGPADRPFVGLQLSHAPVTAIGRLDGDWSNEPEATRRTFEYLIDLARASGVSTAYGIVSDFAAETGWDGFREYAWELEAAGGAIGSHSATHPYDMSLTLAPEEWAREVPGSLRVIREALTIDAPAGDVFINPGNTIQIGDYGRFFADVSLYLTHGFEVFTPYASGVMGFGLPAGVPPRPVVNNTPVPDFQWLYLDGWVYEVHEAAGHQARILGYYQQTVGRGVLYDQMWHDYAVGGNDAPIYFPDTDTLEPLFDANRMHFASERIYAPTIAELAGKMYLAHGVRLSSKMDGDRLVARLDFSAVAEHLPHVAGMGLRVNHAERPIASVTVNGAPHAAFSADTVILPPVQGPTLEVEVVLGPVMPGPRLTYLSKQPAAVLRDGDALEVILARPDQHTRFCVQVPARSVVLHADAYARHPAGGGERDGVRQFCGRMRPGSTAPALMTRPLDTGVYGLRLTAAERRIEHVARTATGVQLALAAGEAGTLTFEAPALPRAAAVDSVPVAPMPLDHGFALALPSSTTASTVELTLSDCDDEDGDGVTTCAGDCDDDDPARTKDCAAVPPGDGGDGDREPPVTRPPSGGCACRAGGASGQGAASVSLVALAILWVRRRGHAGTGARDRAQN